MNAKRVRTQQLGGAKIKLALTLAILGSMAYAGFEIIPAYFANYQLQDTITTEARFATATFPKKSPDDIRNDIWKKMQELGIPAKQEDIKVNAQDQLVSITVDYTVPVDLKVYQFTLDFHPHADSHSI